MKKKATAASATHAKHFSSMGKPSRYCVILRCFKSGAYDNLWSTLSSLSTYPASRGFFFSGAWLLAFVRSLAWLVSGVDGLFTRLTEEEGRNICSHGSKHSDTKEVDSWDITLYWDNNKFNGKLNIFWRQSLERFHSRGQHAVQIHWNKRKLLHKINVQPPESLVWDTNMATV